MAQTRSGLLALMLPPEALPALFAVAEPDRIEAPRPRITVAGWRAMLRGWLGRDTPRRHGFRDRSAASW